MGPSGPAPRRGHAGPQPGRRSRHDRPAGADRPGGHRPAARPQPRHRHRGHPRPHRRRDSSAWSTRRRRTAAARDPARPRARKPVMPSVQDLARTAWPRSRGPRRRARRAAGRALRRGGADGDRRPGDALAALLGRMDARRPRLLGVGLGMPGIVDAKGVVQAPIARLARPGPTGAVLAGAPGRAGAGRQRRQHARRRRAAVRAGPRRWTTPSRSPSVAASASASWRGGDLYRGARAAQASSAICRWSRTARPARAAGAAAWRRSSPTRRSSEPRSRAACCPPTCAPVRRTARACGRAATRDARPAHLRTRGRDRSAGRWRASSTSSARSWSSSAARGRPAWAHLAATLRVQPPTPRLPAARAGRGRGRPVGRRQVGARRRRARAARRPSPRRSTSAAAATDGVARSDSSTACARQATGRLMVGQRGPPQRRRSRCSSLPSLVPLAAVHARADGRVRGHQPAALEPAAAAASSSASTTTRALRGRPGLPGAPSAHAAVHRRATCRWCSWAAWASRCCCNQRLRGLALLPLRLLPARGDQLGRGRARVALAAQPADGRRQQRRSASSGIQGPGWWTDPAWAMPSVILASAWKDLGFVMVILLAGLQAIPEEYYEAAEVDGAARWAPVPARHAAAAVAVELLRARHQPHQQLPGLRPGLGR